MFAELAQLGGTLATVVAFIWYLNRRDVQYREAAQEGHEAARTLSESIGQLRETVATQNELIRQQVSISNTTPSPS